LQNPDDRELGFHGIVSISWTARRARSPTIQMVYGASFQQRGDHANREIVDAENPVTVAQQWRRE
jgi:hypothetical protein